MSNSINIKKILLYVKGQAKIAHEDLDKRMSKIPNVCQPGCDACCYQMVSVHSWEEELIGSYIQSSMHADTKSRVRKQMVEWWRYLKSVLRPATQANPISLYEQKWLRMLMIQERVMCPFLVDRKCSIYPVRPAMCRSHVVVDNPDRCATELGRVGDARGITNALEIFGAESYHLPYDRYPHQMKPLAFSMTGVFKLSVPSTPMEAEILFQAKDGT